jgi:hypothetical protein
MLIEISFSWRFLKTTGGDHRSAVSTVVALTVGLIFLESFFRRAYPRALKRSHNFEAMTQNKKAFGTLFDQIRISLESIRLTLL